MFLCFNLLLIRILLLMHLDTEKCLFVLLLTLVFLFSNILHDAGMNYCFIQDII